MTWDDEGFLISKNRYNENSLIVEIYTKNHGKVSGIVFGGTSKKIKNYLQVGNQLYLNYLSKSDNKMGYFKIEILKAYSPFFFDSQKKLLCLSSAIQLIKILTAEWQKNLKIYNLIEKFYIILKSENWIKDYVFWELELFKIVGYDLELENLVSRDIIDNKVKYRVKSSSKQKFIPNFLIEKKDGNVSMRSLLEGLNLVGDYLEKSILRPNNLNYPNNRLQFINTLK